MSKAPHVSLIVHILAAVLLSYGLSVIFWLGLGVFNLTGFIFISALAAALGVAAGWFTGKRLSVTIIACLIARLGLYVLMMRG